MARWRTLSFLLALLALSSTAPMWSAGATHAEIQNAVVALVGSAELALPDFSQDQIDDLVAGRIVTLLAAAPENTKNTENRAEKYRALAALVSEYPRSALWIATQDPHFATGGDGLVTLELAPESGKACWYGLLDLPFPFSDRQWVIEVWDNEDLSIATAGASWEHVWKERPQRLGEALKLIAEGGLDGPLYERAEAAILVPANHGSWLAVELPSGATLLAFQTSTSVGGLVPDWLVARYARRTLRRLMARVQELAAEVPGHYSGQHALLPGGDGRPIPLFP